MEIEKIPINILSVVRQNLGCSSKTDTSMDKVIETFSPMKLMESYSEWYLSDSIWATKIISNYNILMVLNDE